MITPRLRAADSRFATTATFSVLRNPFEAHLRWRSALGCPLRVNTLQGRLFITDDPEHVRCIFSAPPERFDVFARSTFRAILGDHSIALLSGERHRRARRLLSPSFQASEALALAPTVLAAVERHTGRLREGERIALRCLTDAITLDVILRVLLGVDDPDELDSLAHDAEALLESLHSVLLFVPAFQRSARGLGPFARFQRAVRRIDDRVDQLIARRAISDSGDSLGALLRFQRDALGELSRAEIKDHIRTLLVAGHETTSLAVSWAYHWVARDHDVRARLLAELRPLGPMRPRSTAWVRALLEAPYLDAVCNETLRLSPVLPEVLRTLRSPLDVGGCPLAQGVTVSASMALAHRRADVFPRPTEFAPARFLDRRYAPSQLFPFGGGHRRCIGAPLALLEMKIMLAALLLRCRLRLLSRSPGRLVRRGAMMTPRAGFPVVYEGRAPG